MYSSGNNLPQNDAEAIGWMRSAAWQGYAAAQFNRVRAYFRRLDVPGDSVLARTWLSLATSKASGADAGRYLKP